MKKLFGLALLVGLLGAAEVGAQNVIPQVNTLPVQTQQDAIQKATEEAAKTAPLEEMKDKKGEKIKLNKKETGVHALTQEKK